MTDKMRQANTEEWVLHEILERSGYAALGLQESDGRFPAGWNGPHKQQETAVRTTSHWSILLLEIYRYSNRRVFRNAAALAIDYLKRVEHRPTDKQFVCIAENASQASNGLIGQAWAVEALVKAFDVLGDQESASLALNTYRLHEFHEQKAVWRVPVVYDDGYQEDRRFNHQLWFAAIGSELQRLTGAVDVKQQVLRFLDRLPAHMSTRKNGLIVHASPRFHWGLDRETLRRYKKSARAALLNRNEVTSKEYGYHAFNTYALGILHREFPEHPVWIHSKLLRAASLVETEEYMRRADASLYGTPYNPFGIEAAFTVQEFHPTQIEIVLRLLEKQLAKTFDYEAALMNKNTVDPNTLASRLYEATRLDPNTIVKRVTYQ